MHSTVGIFDVATIQKAQEIIFVSGVFGEEITALVGALYISHAVDKAICFEIRGVVYAYTQGNSDPHNVAIDTAASYNTRRTSYVRQLGIGRSCSEVYVMGYAQIGRNDCRSIW